MEGGSKGWANSFSSPSLAGRGARGKQRARGWEGVGGEGGGGRGEGRGGRVSHLASCRVNEHRYESTACHRRRDLKLCSLDLTSFGLDFLTSEISIDVVQIL